MPKIITIAREYGSGGRLIAQKVAQKLNLVYYDNEVIDLAAKELGFDIDTIRKAAEEKSSSFMYTMSSSAFTLPLNDQVFTTQSKIIRHLAQHDSCIIVNGCADYVLEDFDNVLTVFIHAPFESRVKRVKDEYKEKHDDYQKYVRKKDKGRSNYYNYYTTKKWGQLKNFDLTINSDLGIDLAADMIVEYYLKGQFLSD
jgi:cytidylate kinase